MNNCNERNNIDVGSVFKELKLTLVEVTSANGQNDGQDIRLIALERGDDKQITVFGWLSADGIFYFHRYLDSKIVSRIECELIDMGYHVKPRVYNQ